ncbi:vasoactive intestinal polypeptide receptor-like [Callorhinchus milii]|uniref:vasoactive intestinal polypeptide receptor-like n=1 Tax=Callorhinchus milii TaxID=7868 RepID=UPI001C3FF3A7|nr:vasoactive intestinal polypeptide receptor-like [Callorhinchus milii]
MTSSLLSTTLVVLLAGQVMPIHPECSIFQKLHDDEVRCLRNVRNESLSSGCPSLWDGLSCWPEGTVNETVSGQCPEFLQLFGKQQVEIQRNCTALGWSDPVPPYHVACHIEDLGEIPQSQSQYLATLKVLYTTGHVVSLIALITAISIFCLFRKLHCTRNYIHIHLFTSFVLRVTSIFIKDVVLFADEDINHCTISTVTCKWAVSLSQFCVLANFSWLLVEGLYLQTLLALTFVSDRRYFWWFIGIGWGFPSVTVTVWIAVKLQFDNQGCWDNYDNAYRWVIKASILVTIFVTFLIFLNVIRILIHKICSGRLGGVDRQQCLRLAKSTLLLIPLFGVHYVVFALVPERVGLHARLCFELVLGSLQGFIIALLYCFLNSEVQAELRRRWCKRKTSGAENNGFNLVTQDFTA